MEWKPMRANSLAIPSSPNGVGISPPPALTQSYLRSQALCRPVLETPASRRYP